LFAQGFLAFSAAKSSAELQLMICAVYYLGHNSLLLFPSRSCFAYPSLLGKKALILLLYNSCFILYLFLLLMHLFFFSRNVICIHNIYNILVHIPALDFQKETKFDMWSTVGEYFQLIL
jgi:hypothetical protein